jgi:thiosulfate/3-mercaptopyruvate sulfurtransferase
MENSANACQIARFSPSDLNSPRFDLRRECVLISARDMNVKTISMLTRVLRKVAFLLLVALFATSSFTHLLAWNAMENRKALGSVSALVSEPQTDGNTEQGLLKSRVAISLPGAPADVIPYTLSALPAEPWTAAETVKPADLAREMAEAKGANRPVIVCTGFRFLYEGGHIPGAVFHGPASKPEGLDDLKKWAQGISRSSNVILYCGCCPFEHCPNIRPAFEALRSLGFDHLRVLVLPNNFAKDWVDQGYHSEKGN